MCDWLVQVIIISKLKTNIMTKNNPYIFNSVRIYMVCSIVFLTESLHTFDDRRDASALKRCYIYFHSYFRVIHLVYVSDLHSNTGEKITAHMKPCKFEFTAL